MILSTFHILNVVLPFFVVLPPFLSFLNEGGLHHRFHIGREGDRLLRRVPWITRPGRPGFRGIPDAGGVAIGVVLLLP